MKTLWLTLLPTCGVQVPALLLAATVAVGVVEGLAPSSSSSTRNRETTSRRDFWHSSVSMGMNMGIAMATTTTTTTSSSSSARAVDEMITTSSSSSSSFPYTEAQVKDIIMADIIDRQFLATGQLTRSLYRETATFTDEIDTYGLDQWMKGTQKLFVGDQSHVRLQDNQVNVTPQQIDFRFDEDLMFRIPFRPVVSLSGKVVLKRDEAGYIVSYQEFWDQDVWTVLKTAKFN